MIRTAKRLLLLAVLAIGGVVAVQSSAMAQFTYRCIFINGCKCIVVIDPCGNVVSVNCPCGSTGSGTFSTPKAIPAAGVLAVKLTPSAITATSVDPVLGTITTTLDASRPAPATTIISNQPKLRFPATGIIQFYATATVSSAPNVVYASTKPLVFVNRGLNSVDPFNNETFILREDVDFVNTADPTKTTAFKLQGGTTTVTL